MTTFEEKIRSRELDDKVFDTALPQEWVDEARFRTGEEPFGHFVWSYDGGLIFGYPRSLDIEGDIILGRLAARL